MKKIDRTQKNSFSSSFSHSFFLPSFLLFVRQCLTSYIFIAHIHTHSHIYTHTTLTSSLSFLVETRNRFEECSPVFILSRLNFKSRSFSFLFVSSPFPPSPLILRALLRQSPSSPILMACLPLSLFLHPTPRFSSSFT